MQPQRLSPKAVDAPAYRQPLGIIGHYIPFWLASTVSVITFITTSLVLIQLWRHKIQASEQLHVLSAWDGFLLILNLSSFIYLISFCGVSYLQASFDEIDSEKRLHEEAIRKEAGLYGDHRNASMHLTAIHDPMAVPAGTLKSKLAMGKSTPDIAASKITKKECQETEALSDEESEKLAAATARGEVPMHSLETRLGSGLAAARVRRRAVELRAGRSLDGMGLEGHDYEIIRGACAEMVIGHIQIPVGVAGPLLVDGVEYTVPMATTEGCLIASTNRGCKAITQAGGASTVVLRDGMTRAPVLQMPDVAQAAALKRFVEDPENWDLLSSEFNSSSRFARLQKLHCALAGRTMYLRVECSTGDAMGMNMVSKGTQALLAFLSATFPALQVLGISGNYCADKKATAINWVEGRGKSVVCEAIIPGAVVRSVLKTSVESLVSLNISKNLIGSAMAGALGGFNAHASNIVTAVFLATGQDPAQNVESSACLTLLEAENDGQDLRASVTMPSMEVGTVGGGTFLASQAAALNLLGVKGAHESCPGENARQLARIVAATVLAGELSLMSALAEGQLVKSHLKMNRSSLNLASAAAAANSVSDNEGRGKGEAVALVATVAAGAGAVRRRAAMRGQGQPFLSLSSSDSSGDLSSSVVCADGAAPEGKCLALRS